MNSSPVKVWDVEIGDIILYRRKVSGRIIRKLERPEEHYIHLANVFNEKRRIWVKYGSNETLYKCI